MFKDGSSKPKGIKRGTVLRSRRERPPHRCLCLSSALPGSASVRAGHGHETEALYAQRIRGGGFFFFLTGVGGQLREEGHVESARGDKERIVFLKREVRKGKSERDCWRRDHIRR